MTKNESRNAARRIARMTAVNAVYTSLHFEDRTPRQVKEIVERTGLKESQVRAALKTLSGGFFVYQFSISTRRFWSARTSEERDAAIAAEEKRRAAQESTDAGIEACQMPSPEEDAAAIQAAS